MILLLLLFSFITPAAALISFPFFSAPEYASVQYLSALTAGSLLYVATGELLPEVFHTKARRWGKLGLMLLGMALIVVIELVF